MKKFGLNILIASSVLLSIFFNAHASDLLDVPDAPITTYQSLETHEGCDTWPTWLYELFC